MFLHNYGCLYDTFEFINAYFRTISNSDLYFYWKYLLNLKTLKVVFENDRCSQNLLIRGVQYSDIDIYNMKNSC